MKWKKLLAPHRLGCADAADFLPQRSPFHQDFDRIVFSGSFRRLQDKTQVFPLSRTDSVRTRLTHSIETSSIGRSLGRLAGSFLCEKFDTGGAQPSDVGAIVAAAALAHDIGNPPLGHPGEEAIRHWFTHSPAAAELRRSMTPEEAADIERYEGNAQGFRVLTRLEMDNRYGGMQLTSPTLATLVKYPASSTGGLKKFNFFRSEREFFAEVADHCGLEKVGEECWQRHPLSFLLEAADDIAYLIVDFEDAHRLGLVPYADLERCFLAVIAEREVEEQLPKIPTAQLRAEFLRAKAIGSLVDQASRAFAECHDGLICGSQTLPLLDLIPARDALHEIRRISVERIYNHRRIAEVVAAGFELVSGLLDIFVPCAEEIAAEQAGGPPASFRSRRFCALLPQRDPGAAGSGSGYRRLLRILDYLTSMTDDGAFALYQKLKGISL